MTAASQQQQKKKDKKTPPQPSLAAKEKVNKEGMRNMQQPLLTRSASESCFPKRLYGSPAPKNEQTNKT